MKERTKDPFDYPLRSKKEVMFDQYLIPPTFPVKISNTEYSSTRKSLTFPETKADTRGNQIRIYLNLQLMNLSNLQKKRLIFLLGPRYKGSDVIKITSRHYNNTEKNLAKGIDIVRQLYWEALRAPRFIWEKLKPTNRRRLKRKFGKTKEEREKNMKEETEKVLKAKEEFDALYDTGNYTYEYMMKRLEKIVKEEDDLITKEVEKTKNKLKTVEVEQQTTILEKDIDIRKPKEGEKAVKEKILTKKAYKTFYE
jgi:hypothetical protein